MQRSERTEPQHPGYFIAVGGVLVAVGAVFLGVAGNFAAQRQNYPFATSGYAIVGWCFWGLALVCFVLLAWAFGLLRRRKKSEVDKLAKAILKEDGYWPRWWTRLRHPLTPVGKLPVVVPKPMVERARAALEEVVEGTGTTEQASSPGADPLRIALITARSELATNAVKIADALEERRWWVPSQKLTTSFWTPGSEHFAALADPAFPAEKHARLEHVVQQCHRLNQRIERRHEEVEQTQLFKLGVKRDYNLYPGDEEALKAVRAEIGKVNAEISQQVDGIQP
jgi:cbb3-type cytochrome oxidase subunit 3